MYFFLVAVPSAVTVNRTYYHETYIEKGGSVIFEQNCTEIYRVLGTIVSTGLQVDLGSQRSK